MVSKEEKKELQKIKRMNNEPKDEEKIIPVVENNGQYKIALPKKFTDYLNYKKDSKKAKVTLIKKDKKLVVEIE